MTSVPASAFHALTPWLTGWFSPAGKTALALDPGQEEVFDLLAAGWVEGDVPALLARCAERYGKARVLAVIDLVVATHCRRDWAELARQRGASGVEDLADVLLRPLQAEPGWQFTLTPERGGLQLHCTGCPHAALGERLGISEWVAHLVCGGDPHIVAGFNPRMGFRRTRLLTRGDDHCDHFYFMKDEPPAPGAP